MAAPLDACAATVTVTDAEHSGRYILNSANYQTRVVTHGRKASAAKSRDTHLVAVHSLTDVLELNSALAATAAAMRLPTRTKVCWSSLRCLSRDTLYCRKCFN